MVSMLRLMALIPLPIVSVLFPGVYGINSLPSFRMGSLLHMIFPMMSLVSPMCLSIIPSNIINMRSMVFPVGSGAFPVACIIDLDNMVSRSLRVL